MRANHDITHIRCAVVPILSLAFALLLGELPATLKLPSSPKGFGILAEAVRFELTNGCPLPVFKTGAIDHSATLPYSVSLPVLPPT